jgi:hypothetical protein
LKKAAGAVAVAPLQFPDPLGADCAWLNARPASDTIKPAQSGPSPVDQFQSAHSLSAVLVNGASSLAVINGKPVRLGMSIDGFKLVEVTKTGATLQSRNDQLHMILPTVGG